MGPKATWPSTWFSGWQLCLSQGGLTLDDLWGLIPPKLFYDYMIQWAYEYRTRMIRLWLRMWRTEDGEWELCPLQSVTPFSPQSTLLMFYSFVCFFFYFCAKMRDKTFSCESTKCFNSDEKRSTIFLLLFSVIFCYFKLIQDSL